MTTQHHDTLKDLINDAASYKGDLHIEYFHGMGHHQWGAATCYTHGKDDWEYGRTPEIALKKLIKKLKKK